MVNDVCVRLTVAYGFISCFIIPRIYSTRRRGEGKKRRNKKRKRMLVEKKKRRDVFLSFSFVLTCLLSAFFFLTSTKKRWCRCSTSIIVAKEGAESSKKNRTCSFFLWCSMLLCVHLIFTTYSHV